MPLEPAGASASAGGGRCGCHLGWGGNCWRRSPLAAFALSCCISGGPCLCLADFRGAIYIRAVGDSCTQKHGRVRTSDASTQDHNGPYVCGQAMPALSRALAEVPVRRIRLTSTVSSVLRQLGVLCPWCPFAFLLASLAAIRGAKARQHILIAFQTMHYPLNLHVKQQQHSSETAATQQQSSSKTAAKQ